MRQSIGERFIECLSVCQTLYPREVSAVKYGLNAEGIQDPSCVAPLALEMPGVQVTTGLGSFLHSII